MDILYSYFKSIEMFVMVYERSSIELKSRRKIDNDCVAKTKDLWLAMMIYDKALFTHTYIIVIYTIISIEIHKCAKLIYIFFPS